MTTTTLSTLEVGQTFRLDTKRSFLRLHTYKVIEKLDGKVKYALTGQDKFNQTTTTSGRERVIAIN